MGEVISLKLPGRIAFVTEGQPPVTNGLEVGIAAIVTIVRAVLGQFAQSFLQLVAVVAGEG